MRVHWRVRSTVAWVAATALGACSERVTSPGQEHGGAPLVPAAATPSMTGSPCTTTCYVDATSGDDGNGGDTPASAKKTIQAALNQVSAGGTVRVFPGAYNETAPGSTPTSIAATYQFGLFFGSAKPGITLLGVTAADVPIANAAATLATITTNATNNFGHSGIFIEAANTTIQGVTVGPNVPGNNKTIEVVADGFTLKYSRTAVPGGGAIYISEFDAPATAVPSYTITDNHFTDATQIAISSGAGQTGPSSGRVITGNSFDLGGNSWPPISFNGTGGVPWFTKPVGGAIITGNSFTGGSQQYIRARGTYTTAEFDWPSYWADNTYDKGTVALVTTLPFDVRSFAYTSAPYTFTNVRHIGSTVQGEVDITVAGDVVLAKAGTYPESVTIPRALTLQGAGVGSTVLQGTGGAGTGITLAGGLSNVTIRQLTAQGYNYGITMPSGPLSNVTVEDVATLGNTTHGVWVQASPITDMAFTRLNSSGNNAAGGLGGRGIWLINGAKTTLSITDGTFNNNGLVGIDVSDGNVTGLTITGNTVVGNGDAGIAVLGAKGPEANLVANNTVTNNGRFGIEVKIPTGTGEGSGAGSVVVRDNAVSRTVAATDARDYAGIAVFRRDVNLAMNANQPSGVVVSGNTVSGFTRKPMSSTGDGFGIVVEGTGHVVTGNAVSGNDVGIQIQSGNTANTLSTDYFDRGDAAPSSASINRNSITASTAFDLRNVGAPLTDATCNWFGASTGPVAGKLSGGLITYPWLVTSSLTGACASDAQGPITTIAPPSPAPVSTPITVSVSISDLTTGNLPLLGYSWTFDGGAPVAVSFATSAVAQNFTLNIPASATPEVKSVCVRGTDVYGNVGAETCSLVVWYDPSAGFVTGGGWFDSPAGAYPVEPHLTGRAQFGFVSKYVKGKTAPTGNTEFQFQAGDIQFASTTYDWLVVNQSASNAQFKGTGTLNGVAGYEFMAWAKDDAPDTFRIKITNPSGVVVYDNSKDGEFGTPLGGGSIIVHVPKK